MDDENIMYLLPSIAAARLFYSFGKLDEMIQVGIEAASDDFQMYYWELLTLTADFADNQYREVWEVDHWYFSNESMVEYYRLCRIYSQSYRIKLSANPYMEKARRFVNSAMNLYCTGYDWHLQTKVNHKWASGIVFETDCYFNGEMEILEALLEIQAWYNREVVELRNLLEKEAQKPFKETEVLAA